jgi:hypothetical protein
MPCFECQNRMKTDKVVKNLGAGAKNNTECRSFSYGIRSLPTVFLCRVCCIPFVALSEPVAIKSLVF